jgi:signal transduction histidine kinase
MPDRARKRINQINNTIEQMRLLINDILTIGRIEANRLVLNLTKIDMVDLTQSVINDFEVIANSKQIRLFGKLPTEPTFIYGDLNLIRRVLDNLVDNAIKFSHQQSLITIKIEKLPENPARRNLIKIQIIDQGVGISPEQKQVIFEKYKVGNIILGISQIGLGLSFCKMAIEAHQGEITVTNNQPNGAIFTVLLGCDNSE